MEIDKPSGPPTKRMKLSPNLKLRIKKNLNPFSIFTAELDLGLCFLQQNDLSSPFVFSPIATSLGFSLLHSVTNEKTQKEIRKILLEGSTEDTFKEHFKRVELLLSYMPNANELTCGKHLFVRPGTSHQESDDTSIVDFNNSPGVFINTILSSKTDNLIDDVTTNSFPMEDLDILLATAFHFTARCRGEIISSSRKVFYKTLKNKKTIEYWTILNTCRISANDDFEMISSNYILGSNYTFTIIRPKVDFKLKEVLHKLDSATIEDLIGTATEHLVRLAVPKFETHSRQDVKKVNEVLGIKVDDEKNKELEKIGFAQAVSFKLDKYQPKDPGAVNTSNYDKPVPDCLDFIVNQPFIYIIAKNNHPILMGYFN